MTAKRNSPIRHRSSVATIGSTLVTAAVLQACGGGGGDGNTTVADPGSASTPTIPATFPATLAVSGRVFVEQAVRLANVCVDLDGNGSCDSGEPRSATTPADGSYSVAYTAADAAAAARFNQANLLALIGEDAYDAADASSSITSTSFILRTPVSKPAQINPLTTLVVAGVTSGLSLAASEAAVSTQLGVAVAKIYDYQTDGPQAGTLPDTATTVAKVVTESFARGTPTTIAIPGAAPAPYSNQIVQLRYTDAGNYLVRARKSDGVTDERGYVSVFEPRRGMAGGVALPFDALYTSAYLGPNGWTRCTDTAALLATRGNPSRGTSCGGAIVFISFTTGTTDLSGQSIAAVVSAMQGQPGNTITVSPPLFGEATFPAGSTLRTVTSLNPTQSYYINNLANGDMTPFATIEALIAGRPASAVNLATSAGTGGVGSLDSTHSLRAAYIDGNTAQIYRCDVAGGVSSNCMAYMQTPISVVTVNGARLLTFSGLPLGSGQTIRGYGEYDGRVYATYRNTTAQSVNVAYSQRLNDIAGNAVLAALGI